MVLKGAHFRVVMAAAVLAGLVPAAQAQAAAAPSTPAKAQAPTSAAITRVTLVTGDVVAVTSRPTGRPHIAVNPGQPNYTDAVTLDTKRGTFVIPSSALAGLRDGWLDEQLFNVTTLIDSGYDDEHSASLPIIVTSTTSPLVTPTPPTEPTAPSRRKTPTLPPQAAVKLPPTPAFTTLHRALPSLGASAVRMTKTDARAFWRSMTGIGAPAGAAPGLIAGQRIILDGKAHATTVPNPDPEPMRASTGVKTAWDQGLDGTGVKIAVVDTGIDDQNADLTNVVAQADFTGQRTTDDFNGHGTAVASVIAGNGAASGGTYEGLAPGASLVDARALDDTGYGNDSDIIAAMQWSIDQGAKVVNMSLGTGIASDGTDVLSQAADVLSVRSGALFVVAAGNNGPEASTIGGPGAATEALTVAATGSNYYWPADFSSAGPRLDGALKPDIATVGVDVVSAQADGTQLGDQVAPGYVSLSGTSLATPFVAGAAGLMLQKNPTWQARRLKSHLMTSAMNVPSAYRVGSGVLNIDAALTGPPIDVEGGTTDLGYFAYPQGDLSHVTHDVTFTNLDPVSSHQLDLGGLAGGGVTDSTGTTAVVLSASPAALDLPPGGSATTTLSGDFSAMPLGPGSGGFLAIGESSYGVHTAMAYTLEPERYSMAATVLGLDGKPFTGTAVTVLMNLDTGRLLFGFEATTTARLEPGTWTAVSLAWNATAEYQLTSPEFQVNATSPRTLQLDMRQALQMELAPADTSVQAQSRGMSLVRETPDVTLEASFAGSPLVQRTTWANPVPAVTIGTLDFGLASSWSKPQLTASTTTATAGAAPVSTPLTLQLATGDNRLDGTRTAPLALASGKVAGAVVLLDTAGGDLGPTMASLKKAGAVAVILYRSTRMGFSYWAEPAALPVVVARDADGIALAASMAAGKTSTIKITCTAFPPLIYNLARGFPNVPAAASKTYAKSDLHQLQESYQDWGSPSFSYQDDYPDFRAAPSLPTRAIPAAGTRTVFTSPETAWISMAIQFDNRWSVDVGTVMSAGGTSTRQWFAQLGLPGLSAHETKLVPVGDDLWLTGMSSHSDALGRRTGVAWEEGTWSVTVDGAKVKDGDLFSVPVVPFTGVSSFRFDLDSDVPASATLNTLKRSRHVQSSWTVPVSGTIDQPTLGWLDLGVALPLASDATAKTRSTMTFDVNARLPLGAAATLSSLTLDTSIDGGLTWQPAKSVPVDADTYRVTVVNAANPASVSVRMNATGPGGMARTATVWDAYAVVR